MCTCAYVFGCIYACNQHESYFVVKYNFLKIASAIRRKYVFLFISNLFSLFKKNNYFLSRYETLNLVKNRYK